MRENGNLRSTELAATSDEQLLKELKDRYEMGWIMLQQRKGEPTKGVNAYWGNIAMVFALIDQIKFMFFKKQS